jgi:hypothetical protein
VEQIEVICDRTRGEFLLVDLLPFEAFDVFNLD